MWTQRMQTCVSGLQFIIVLQFCLHISSVWISVGTFQTASLCLVLIQIHSLSKILNAHSLALDFCQFTRYCKKYVNSLDSRSLCLIILDNVIYKQSCCQSTMGSILFSFNDSIKNSIFSFAQIDKGLTNVLIISNIRFLFVSCFSYFYSLRFLGSLNFYCFFL